ncbi:MAG: putative lipid II flippase FtsW [Gammaproteobacteria bacterium]|nr:putative lipid II flippase FtsW [Gammaproteobacteria bacterium]
MRERKHIEPVIGEFCLPDWDEQDRQASAPWEEPQGADVREEPFETREEPLEVHADANPPWETQEECDEPGADEDRMPWEEPVPVLAEAADAIAALPVDTDSLLARRVAAVEPEPEADAQEDLAVAAVDAAEPDTWAPAPEPAPAEPSLERELPAEPVPVIVEVSGPGQSKSLARLGERVRHLAWYDRQLLVAAVALLAIGLIMVTSSSLAIAEKETGNSFYYALRHGFYLAVALAGALVVMQVPMNFWARWCSYLLLAGIALLALILVPGLGHEVNGSVRWIRLGGFTLQVSELVKLALVLFMANYLVRKTEEVRTQVTGFLKPLALLGLLALLLLAEPDFGATVVVFSTAFAMMFLAGARLWQYLAIGAAGLAGLWFIAIASPYRMKRLTTFLDPWADPYGSGYQLTQSLIAFGRGGLTGQGLGNSVQKLAYLPEAHTDFVFAVLAEELGLLGVASVLLVFGWLTWRIFRVGRRALDAGQPFAGYIAFGIAVWLSLQCVVNIGVASGILPTKGLTLPLVSYGGSSLIVTCAAIAIVLRIDYERRMRVHFGLGRGKA